MFQSTPHLMFRLIPSLGIHPPLPLNARESKQLLNLLTTSFRQHLDREHGTFPPEANGSDKVLAYLSTSKYGPSKRRRHSQSRPEARVPIDNHLRSILTNPLFNYGLDKSDSLVKSLRDPMDIFDEACAKGFMKIEYATACLKAKKNLIVRSSVLSVRDAMKSSEAGWKVLRWLLSSGEANNVAFLQDEAFTEVLVDFLVAEKLQVAVWVWMAKLLSSISMAGTQSTAYPASKSAAHLVYALVKAEASGFVSLDTAYASLERARDQADRLRCQTRRILSRAGLFLSCESTFQSSLHPAASPAMFSSFLNMVPAFTAHTDLHLSHLQLHHPTKPDANLALQFLKKVKNEISTLSEGPPLGPYVHHSYPNSRIIGIGLDTAKHFFEREQHANARWAMNFLQETYAKQLGLSQQKKLEQAQAEASSLELLKNLNLA